ncbi:hypothetical protein GCM10012288_24890 [Malaciobacter pacificus]|uniref:Uncharacterized protein n=1 Tax=Malaciobacter pacificus TaxID=1080223 RepID=A0A5C2HA12_9BACT|nr:hypothetical protein [Malaciobacter pacificus]QEP35048.1 hypothetical protein APAC_1976 [Malaciobacter pacificus]GGD49885.1 hypothetical protein GCM10012288_24890 [Malaciobacter pacificus]
MDEKLEANYEIQVFRKSDSKFIDSYYLYSDDKSTALNEGIKHYENLYPISDYNFVVEYWGEFESDRGFEMSLDSELHSNLDTEKLSNLLNNLSENSSIANDLKFANEQIIEIKNSNLSAQEKEFQIKVLNETIENLREIQ